MDVMHDTLRYLYSLQSRGMKLGLERVRQFREALDYPDTAYPTFHIAGTNGKGSTVRYLAAILQTSGLRTGSYTSPHLIRFNERVRVNEVPIPDAVIIDFVQQWSGLIDDLELTFFETTTMLALEYFRKQQVEVAVLETGLGGRLDATNIVSPVVSIVTSIGLEHTEILGDTIPEIAWEKAGIFKPEIPCVVGAVSSGVREVFEQRAAEIDTPLMYVGEACPISEVQLLPDRSECTIHWQQKPYKLVLSMLGWQAVLNASIALTAGQTQEHFTLPWEQSIGALRDVVIPGRLQLMSQHPTIYYDVAHNYDGIGNLIHNLELMHPGKQMKFLLGVNSQKNITSLQELFPADAVISILDIPDVSTHSLEYWRSILTTRTVEHLGVGAEAVSHFRQSLNPSDLGIIAGSHYLARYVYEVFDFLLDT